MKAAWFAAAVLFSAAPGLSAPCRPSYDGMGHRYYYDYPYAYSYGVRYDPYWSYKSSYFPETYHGDGSYYGLGYSGYGGRGWYGNYWYW